MSENIREEKRRGYDHRLMEVLKIFIVVNRIR